MPHGKPSTVETSSTLVPTSELEQALDFVRELRSQWNPGDRLPRAEEAALQERLSRLGPETRAHGAHRLEDLCNDNQFAEAAPLAALLLMCEPQNSRIAYLAGVCQQALGNYALAMQLYGYSLLGDVPNASACYRVGECHLSMGNVERAIEAWEATIEIAREQPQDGHILHELASTALARVRKAMPPEGSQGA